MEIQEEESVTPKKSAAELVFSNQGFANVKKMEEIQSQERS
jgi:hypothetical protein